MYSASESVAKRFSSSQKPSRPSAASASCLRSCIGPPAMLGHALELAEQRVHLRAVRATRERERAQVERRGAGVVELERGELGVVARLEVDERDRDARLARVGDEQELVARGRGLLDDHLGERRQQVALDRALERPRAELGREALRDDELGRRPRRARPPTAARAGRGA